MRTVLLTRRSRVLALALAVLAPAASASEAAAAQRTIATAPPTSSQRNERRRVFDYDGTDTSQRLAAAIADAPERGIVVLQSDEPVVLTSGVSIAKPLTLELSTPMLILRDGVEIRILANSVSVTGTGRVPVRLGTRAGFRVGAASTPVYDWFLANLHVSPSPGAAAGSTAIILTNAREGRLEHAYVEGFTGEAASALHIRDNCWSNRITDSVFVRSTAGIALTGGEINALTISGSNISHNRYGLWISGGSMHGLSIVAGTQIEGNKIGILVEAGTIHALSITDIYAEVPSGTQLLVARSSGARALILRVWIGGGYVYTEDGLPMVFDASATRNDSIRVAVMGVAVTSKAGDRRLISASGSRSSVTVRDVSIMDRTLAQREPLLSLSNGAMGTVQ
jgi:hypothetical protein